MLYIFGQLRSISLRSIFTSAILRKGRWSWYDIQKRVTNPQYAEPDYWDKQAAAVSLGHDYIDKLGAIWYERESSKRDLLFRREDYLIKHKNYWLPEVAPDTPRIGYEDIDTLQSAPVSVRKIFSVGFGRRKDVTDQWRKMIMDKVRQHRLDDNSLEAKIAHKTFVIRQLSKLLFDQEKKPGWIRKLIILSLDHRRKLLKWLRQQNRESFENVLQQLQIAYRIPPQAEDVPLQTRKGWVEHQVRLRTEAVKEQKLAEYRDRLKAKLPEYLERKARLLPMLEKEETELRAELNALTTAYGERLNVVGDFRGHSIDVVSENKIHRDFYRPRQRFGALPQQTQVVAKPKEKAPKRKVAKKGKK